MDTSVNQRIKFLREKLNLSQYELTSRLKISQSRLARIELNKVEVELPLLTHIAYELGINRNWLLTGEGEMYANAEKKEENRSIPVAVVVDDSNEEKIVLVPEKAEAGYLKSFEHGGLMIDFLKKLPTISLPGADFHNATFRAFEVSGHSMEPTFYPRDIVICRFIEHYSYIRNKEIYIIVTKNDGIIIKRVVKQESGLELHSDNDDFEPYIIGFEDIFELWKFEARITKHAPMPARRLKKIEENLSMINQQLTLQFKFLNEKK
jgi:phage repressor protein C with HTH and peptisase S24 domain